MQRYFDKFDKRLVYIGDASNSRFWDQRWKDIDIKKRFMASSYTPGQRWIVKETLKYLPRGSSILEGGCGIGDKVYALVKEGYKVIGIDYAEKTIKRIKKIEPDLPVKQADIRTLPFDGNSFDGYWSLGVIEHFQKGFVDIAVEMHRVLKNGGYLFVTFPAMSKLRKFKAARGLYPNYVHSKLMEEYFYQYALNSSYVIDEFIGLGFEFIYKKGLNGIKGLSDEIPLVAFPMKVFFKLAYTLTEKLTRGFANHSDLLVFRKP